MSAIFSSMTCVPHSLGIDNEIESLRIMRFTTLNELAHLASPAWKAAASALTAIFPVLGTIHSALTPIHSALTPTVADLEWRDSEFIL